MPEANGPLPEDVFDVAVIGGGINGTGVARDLALRGLKVVLFERNDLAYGASRNSSGMIHGGVRYLSRAPHVTETSCRDSGYIQRIAPHLLFRIPFIFPQIAKRPGKSGATAWTSARMPGTRPWSKQKKKLVKGTRLCRPARKSYGSG